MSAAGPPQGARPPVGGGGAKRRYGGRSSTAGPPQGARPASAPRFAIAEVECFERPVTLRLPFRFGSATVREAPQAFVRARIVAPDGKGATGMAAELMIPKWFDKDPARDNARNVDDLRGALRAAAEAYTSERASAGAFEHASRHYRALLEAGTRAGRNALTSSYGPALVDRAVLDALCRWQGMAFAAAVRANRVGLDARLTPDLAGFALDGFLAALPARRSIAARHTIGLVDPLDDDTPESLRAIIARYGHRYFKIKLGGDVDADVARLAAIASVLDSMHDYAVTFDGNEQFADVAAVRALHDAVTRNPSLRRLARSVLYLEQPLARAATLDIDVSGAAGDWPLLIDEADDTLDAFPRARRRGYAGVSSKSCKGVYKSLLNAARCAQANALHEPPSPFVSGEDLTSQAGIAVQQDLSLVTLLGLAHVERNGHHYVDGFAGQGAGRHERQAFVAAHPDLYVQDGDNVRLRITAGEIRCGSLDMTGFGADVTPDPASLTPLSLHGTAALS